jgi:glycosyltransferase involved in cell wall biosynthesis
MPSHRRRLRIAQVAPLFESVPPAGYGGTERVVSYLTEALVEMGHDVTLYASGDSCSGARVVSVIDEHLGIGAGPVDANAWSATLVDEVLQRAGAYDVIHFHTDIVHLPGAARCATPSLTTLHGRLDLPALKPLYRRFSSHPLVSISASQRAPLPRAGWCATIHHGLPAELYAFQPRPGRYFAFLGRISPEKRLDRAIEIAKRSGVPLHVAASVNPADKDYFATVIEPLMHDPLIRFVGEISDAQKNDFLGQALALLMPIDWPEPFGLVMIEALACGTPVIAYANGSVPEIIDDGVTGFVVHNQAEAVAAAKAAGQLDRRHCREAFERRFTATSMARAYLALYRELIARQPGAGPYRRSGEGAAAGAGHGRPGPDR